MPSGTGSMTSCSPAGGVTGIRGTRLAPTHVDRGVATNRDPVGEFEHEAPIVVVTSGGIGGNHDLVRANWPVAQGDAPAERHAHWRAGTRRRPDAGHHLARRRTDRQPRADVALRRGRAQLGPDLACSHAIRILAGPSSIWLDGNGKRLPAPYYPGFDTLGTLRYLRGTGHDHSWFVLNRRIAEKEFTLSGSEQNPDITAKSVRRRARAGRAAGCPSAVQAFLDKGVDFVQAARRWPNSSPT
jgi:predicted oxidoreductase